MRMSKVWGMATAAMVAAVLAAPAMQAQGRNRDRSDDRGRYSDDDGPRETENVDRTIAMPPNGTLRLRNFSGDIHVTATSGRDVIMKARRRASRDRLDHIKLDVQTSGSTVTIDANHRDREWEDRRNNNVVETSFELQVPASVHLDIDAFSSEVTVDGMNGDQRLKTFSGNLIVRNVKQDIDAETFSGDIRVTVDRNARGSVSFHTFSGDIDSELAISTRSNGSRWNRNVEGTLPGGAGPRLQFRTFSGDVELRSR